MNAVELRSNIRVDRLGKWDKSPIALSEARTKTRKSHNARIIGHENVFVWELQREIENGQDT